MDAELADLEKTLTNIETARPFEDLTVVCDRMVLRLTARKRKANPGLQEDVAAAEPQIDERTSQLVSKGRWQVPGYKVRENSCQLIHEAKLKFDAGEIRRSLSSLDYCSVPLTISNLELLFAVRSYA